jgi:hypothetical protein
LIDLFGNEVRSAIVDLYFAAPAWPDGIVNDTLFGIGRYDLICELFEAWVAAQGVEHRLDFDQAQFRKLFVLLASFEAIDRFVLITKAEINQGKAEGPDSATLLEFFQLREQLQCLFAPSRQAIGMGQVC